MRPPREAVRRLWHGGPDPHTVHLVFIVAAADLKGDGKRHDSESVAKALRRVGADVVVLTNCEHGSGSRIKRQARYEQIESATGAPAVTVLANRTLRRCPERPDATLLCEVRIAERRTRVAAGTEEPLELYRLLIELESDDPLVVVGSFDVDLNNPSTIAELHAHDTLDSKSPSRTGGTRTSGIVTRGLHTYGAGEYHSDDGLVVCWIRVGY